MMFALIGIAFAWSLIYILIAAAGFAACTWLARSLSRALISVVAALGVLAGLLGLGSRFSPELLTSLGINWSLVFVAWWLLALAGAAAYRRSNVEPDFGIAEMIGCGLGIAMAISVAIKLDFHSDLIGYMLQAEDNDAWLSLATHIAASDSVGATFSGNSGIVVPLMLGLLHTAQQATDPTPNAVFAAYSLGIMLSPLAATTLLRGVDNQRRLVIAAFAALVIVWAYHAPAILYSNFGHLAVLWCLLGLLLTISFAMFDRLLPWVLPVGLALVFFVGGGWFPIAALMMGIAVWFCWPFAKRLGPIGTGVGVAALLVTAAILSVQAASIGLTPGGSQGTIDTLKGLLGATGGTASVDPLILVAALGGVVGLSVASVRRGPPVDGALFIMLGLVAYLTAVYALSYALQTGVAYGITKMTFLLMSAVIVVLIAVIPRFNVPARPMAAIITVLAFGSFLSAGGGADLLARTWPGEPRNPVFLAPLQTIAKSQNPANPRPIACFSADPMQAYQCTRLAESFTTAGDQFSGLRTAAVTGGDVVAQVTALRKTGVLERSDLLILTPLTLPWGQQFFNDAGRVFDLSGNRIPNGRQMRAAKVKRANARRGR